MKMNDFAIGNIQRILDNEIASGKAVIGIISVDENSNMHLCWRTDDPKTAMQWEKELKTGVSPDAEIIRTIQPLPTAEAS